MLKKYIVAAVVACAGVQSCAQITGDNAAAPAPTMPAGTPKNIIMIVADGMGPAYTTAYRNYRDNPDTPDVETVVFDDILVGNASTYPAGVSGYVTDSAAAATALASGVKSYNGAIGVNADKQNVESVLQRAKALNMRTGVAVTSQINHATPASYIAHNESRKNYNALADSYFDDRINGKFVADVMLGGGTSYFERKDRDLVAQFIDSGYEYVDTYNRLASLPKGSDVLGLFAPVGLPAALDDSRKNRLAYLTEHAIKHLENDNGFFLLVEASQVDWAGHSNDIGSAMAEMHDLALTLDYLKTYVKSHPDTLVVLTADHSTGGLTIGANGEYAWQPEFIKNMKRSVATMAQDIENESDAVAYVEDSVGFSLTDEERNGVNAMMQQGDARSRYAAINKLLDIRTNTGWTTGGHTGVDVEVFAFGAGKDAFAGQLDNTDIAKNIFGFLNSRPATKAAVKQPESKKTNPDVCDFKEDWRCQ